MYLYLSRSAFLVSFTDPNKQLPNVKFVYKFLNCAPSLLEIYRFITLLWIQIILFVKMSIIIHFWQKIMINKILCKSFVWLSYFFNTFFWQSSKFPRFNASSASKIFNVFFSHFSNFEIPADNYFVRLRILNLFIKSFVNLFVDITLTFFQS